MNFPGSIDKNKPWGVLPVSEVLIFTVKDFREEHGFQRLVAEKRAAWIRMATSILKNDFEAEDLVQDTLAILWERRYSLKIENPESYAARAVWLNALKRRARTKNHISLEEAKEIAAAEADQPEWGEISPLVLEKAVENLSEAQRTIIRMKYYTGLSFKEIGAVLKISLNTAGSRCRYALKALRGNLSGR